MPWLQIRKRDRLIGQLLELTGSRIESDWGNFHVDIFQSNVPQPSVTIRFNSREQMQAFLKTLIALLRNDEKFMDTGVEDMDYKDILLPDGFRPL